MCDEGHSRLHILTTLLLHPKTKTVMCSLILLLLCLIVVVMSLLTHLRIIRIIFNQNRQRFLLPRSYQVLCTIKCTLKRTLILATHGLTKCLHAKILLLCFFLVFLLYRQFMKTWLLLFFCLLFFMFLFGLLLILCLHFFLLHYC